MLADFKDRRIAWCVVISGLPYRYYSEIAPGADLNGGNISGTTTLATDVQAVLSVGPIVASVEDLGGIARQDPVEVQILARDAPVAGTATPNDPILTLRRLTPSGSTRATRLLTTVPHSLASADVEVETDVSAWTTPGFLHTGQETMYYTGTAGDGSVGDRYRFTGISRAVAGTNPQRHIVSETQGERPYVLSDVVFWRGRRARIYWAPILADGTAGDWLEYWRGLIDSVPDVIQSGMVIRLRVAPLTASLKNRLGASTLQTKTVRGWHYLSWPKACYVNLQARWEQNALWWLPSDGLETVAPNGLHNIDNSAQGLTKLYDPTTYGPGHSLHGAVRSTTGAVEQVLSLLSDTIKLPLDSVLYTEFPAIGYGNPQTTQGYRVALMEGSAGAKELVRWPDRLMEVVNDGTAWQTDYSSISSWGDPGTITTPAALGEPRWAKVRIAQGDGGWIIEACRNLEVSDPEVPAFVAPAHFRYELDGIEDCWAGFSIRPVEDLEHLRRLPLIAQMVSQPDLETWDINQHVNNDDQYPWTSLQILGAPEWWYQPGEDYIGPFEDNIYDGGGTPQVIRVTGGEWASEVEVISSSLKTSGGVDIGWVYGINPDGDGRYTRGTALMEMRADAPHVAIPLSMSSGVSVPVYILRLLLSGAGNGTNHATYDCLPYGSNLGSSDVDVDSFTAFEVPSVLSGTGLAANSRFEAVPEKTFAENTKALLLACGAQIVQRYDTTYGWRLALIPLGGALQSEPVATITDDDCTADGLPESMIEGRVVRSYKVSVNYPIRSVDKGEPDVAEIPDRASINAANGDWGEKVELELRGIVLPRNGQDIASQVLPVTIDIRARLGYERMRWRLTVPADHTGLEAVSLGTAVTLTSDTALDIDPSEAVSGRVCRVMGFKRDLSRHTLELELVAVPGLYSGYVPSMYVTAKVDDDTVTVAANAYSTAPLTDVGYFLVGDEVDCVPVGDWANRVCTTIKTISGNNVTTNASHGLVKGDTIRVNDYVGAGRCQVYAYLSDGLVLGTGTDPGYTIS